MAGKRTFAASANQSGHVLMRCHSDGYSQIHDLFQNDTIFAAYCFEIAGPMPNRRPGRNPKISVILEQSDMPFRLEDMLP